MVCMCVSESVCNMVTIILKFRFNMIRLKTSTFTHLCMLGGMARRRHKFLPQHLHLEKLDLLLRLVYDAPGDEEEKEMVEVECVLRISSSRDPIERFKKYMPRKNRPAHV